MAVTYRADRVAGATQTRDGVPTVMFENADGPFGVALPTEEMAALIDAAAILFSAPDKTAGELTSVRALNVSKPAMATTPDGENFILQFQLLAGGQLNLGLSREQLDQLDHIIGAALAARRA